MLYISLGVHGVLLMLPIPSTPEPKATLKQKPIKISQLPSQPSVKPSPSIQLPKPSPKVQPTPLVATRPQVKSLRPQSAPIFEVPQPTPIVQQNTPIPSPSPSPIASATPSPSPSPIASPTPSPSPSPIASATPSPSPSPTNPLEGISELADFKAGCNGKQQGCWQVEGTNMRSIASNQLDLLLKKQGYSLLENEEIDDDHRKVYRVSNKDGEIEYLHVLATDDGGAVMLFANRKDLTREQLIAMAKG